jgi:hypothetical protein
MAVFLFLVALAARCEVVDVAHADGEVYASAFGGVTQLGEATPVAPSVGNAGLVD